MFKLRRGPDPVRNPPHYSTKTLRSIPSGVRDSFTGLGVSGLEDVLSEVE